MLKLSNNLWSNMGLDGFSEDFKYLLLMHEVTTGFVSGLPIGIGPYE